MNTSPQHTKELPDFTEVEWVFLCNIYAGTLIERDFPPDTQRLMLVASVEDHCEGSTDPETERFVEKVRALTVPQADATMDEIQRRWADDD